MHVHACMRALVDVDKEQLLGRLRRRRRLPFRPFLRPVLAGACEQSEVSGLVAQPEDAHGMPRWSANRPVRQVVDLRVGAGKDEVRCFGTSTCGADGGLLGGGTGNLESVAHPLPAQ